MLGGVTSAPQEALSAASEALDDGRAVEHFAVMVSALGGPSDLLEAPGGHLPIAPSVGAVFPAQEGVVPAVDVRAAAMAIIGHGGGRARESDAVDDAVGLTEVAAIGERSRPAAGSWRWCTPVTPTAPHGPPTTCTEPTCSATARRRPGSP